MLRGLALGVGFLTAAMVIGCGESSSTAGDHPGGGSLSVSRTEFGKDWPLTVDRGTLSCDGSGVIFTTGEGDEYGVNGTAKGLGYPEIDPIWKENDSYDLPGDGPPLRVDISPLIDRGLELCQ
jgi:hypothetical protein